ncbi:UNVERIFIED_CONTAM: hypothetical protein GTU68_064877 [Idotea baltica]|nr:hypothetical protein [Idotea baltica]
MSNLKVSEIEDRGYEKAEVLVSTEWLAENLDNENVRIIESNEDQLLYPSGHIPGAVEVDWIRDLNDPVTRDYLDKDAFEKLASRIGITPDTTLVFYGDKNNWWSCYAFWIFQLFGHTNAKILDGGSLKWKNEKRELVRDVPKFAVTKYTAPERDDSTERAFLPEVLKHVEASKALIDVRSPEEYSGERLHMPDYPNEGAVRGGHVPGAKNVPWAKAINPENGTFKNVDELKKIYFEGCKLQHDDDVIAYCRIGERSSHSWFVLKYLLGMPNVRNYDGSWTEYGNSMRVPIEK